jgi:hypothetical protein
MHPHLGFTSAVKAILSLWTRFTGFGGCQISPLHDTKVTGMLALKEKNFRIIINHFFSSELITETIYAIDYEITHTEKYDTHTYIHTASDDRTHDRSVREIEGITCLRLCGYFVCACVGGRVF